MTEVKSKEFNIRSWFKPFLFKSFPKLYDILLLQSKIRDIQGKLVEEVEMEILPKLLSKNDVCFDIGANYLYFSHRLCELCYNGQVYSFEPVKKTYQTAQKISKHFKLNNIKLMHFGLSKQNTDAIIKIPIQPFGAINASIATLQQTNVKHYLEEKITLITLDSFVEANNILKLNFLKIDVEGHEIDVLQGAHNTIKQFNPIIYIELSFEFFSQNAAYRDFFETWLIHNHYQIYTYHKPSKKLLHFTNQPSTNYFLIPKFYENKLANEGII